ncbi:hypothetical protein F4780DRAFT_748581 [Xylariomycetidae sp. FL0641]|nr:hypothetical protein F4780DRAFT_748581 [Xylariomycetidae sp. FL0641]
MYSKSLMSLSFVFICIAGPVYSPRASLSWLPLSSYPRCSPVTSPSSSPPTPPPPLTLPPPPAAPTTLHSRPPNAALTHSASVRRENRAWIRPNNASSLTVSRAHHSNPPFSADPRTRSEFALVCRLFGMP